jgi:hypothetical protein
LDNVDRKTKFRAKRAAIPAVFQFEGVDLRLSLSADLPFSEVQGRVAEGLHLPTDAFEVRGGGRVIEAHKTLTGYAAHPTFEVVRVRHPIRFLGSDTERILHLPYSESIGSVRGLVAKEFSLPATEFDLSCAGRVLADSETLESAGRPSELGVRSRVPVVDFHFEARVYQLRIARTAPLSEVLPKLASELHGVAADGIAIVSEAGDPLDALPPAGRVTVARNRVFEFERSVATFPVDFRLPCRLLRPPLSTALDIPDGRTIDIFADPAQQPLGDDQTFEQFGNPVRLIVRLAPASPVAVTVHFEGESYQLTIDPDLPLWRRVAEAVGVDPSQLIILFGDSQVDAEMTLENLGRPPSLQVKRDGQSLAELKVRSVCGREPLEFTLSLLPAQTLGEAEPDIKAKCGMQGQAVEFAQFSRVNSETTPVSRSQRIAEFAGDCVLIVQRPARPPRSPGDVVLAFAVRKPEPQQFTEQFKKTETIAEARARIADRLHYPVQAITLLFVGKPLRDNFTLGYLNIGQQAITVHVQQS